MDYLVIWKCGSCGSLVQGEVEFPEHFSKEVPFAVEGQCPTCEGHLSLSFENLEDLGFATRAIEIARQMGKIVDSD